MLVHTRTGPRKTQTKPKQAVYLSGSIDENGQTHGASEMAEKSVTIY